MKILLEGSVISNELLKSCSIPENFLTRSKNSQYKCDYVGYIRESDKEPIMIIPKIFSQSIIDEYCLGKTEAREWISDYCIKQYLTLKKYFGKFKSYTGNLPESTIFSSEVTYIDVALAVIDFYSKHKYLFVIDKQDRITKNPNNVKWNKMLNSMRYKIVNNTLIFEDFNSNLSKNSTDDFLLKLLNNEVFNISKLLNIKVNIEQDSTLDRVEYAKFIKNPLKNLKKLRKNYFRDDFVKLYKVLYSYYSVTGTNKTKGKCEFYLTNSFQLVFESMVDGLLSDEELVKEYKYNRDGKIIDHIFGFTDFIFGRKTIYIGDSKYYKDDTDIKHQQWKQYTYARNVASYVILKENELNKNIRSVIFDKCFGGYNIIPNFFVSAEVDEIPYKKSKEIFWYNDLIEPNFSCHFENRIFDRDTFHVIYFKVNLLVLINKYLYGWNKKEQGEIKVYIRDKFIDYFEKNYSFYQVEYSDENRSFFENNIYLFQGKIFGRIEESIIIIGLEKGKSDDLIKKLEDCNIDFKEINIKRSASS